MSWMSSGWSLHGWAEIHFEGLILATGRAGEPAVCKIHNFLVREAFLEIPSLNDSLVAGLGGLVRLWLNHGFEGYNSPGASYPGNHPLCRLATSGVGNINSLPQLLCDPSIHHFSFDPSEIIFQSPTEEAENHPLCRLGASYPTTLSWEYQQSSASAVRPFDPPFLLIVGLVRHIKQHLELGISIAFRTCCATLQSTISHSIRLRSYLKVRLSDPSLFRAYQDLC
ncbi:hypothetical protein F2Q70_00015311 [Brassica cretica]|uniref:Uncharacterized protein n=1 Tax=Brassica cretica TaxID=69181 RepID=A0A8S9HSB5_BRACR|nr:hypothetical protein F2Q70_00015311 [Brassica cretica]